MIYVKPERPNASQVQAEFYRRALNSGLEMYVEYTATVDEKAGIYPTRKGRQRRCRFDVIAIHGDRIICIIECKSYTDRVVTNLRADRRSRSYQRMKYESFMVPVLYVCRLADIDSTIAKIRALRDKAAA